MSARAVSLTDDHIRQLILLLRLERILASPSEEWNERKNEMRRTQLNYWLLDTLPDRLQDLADYTTTAPEGLSLPVWKATLERMVFLFREANADTCQKYAAECKDPDSLSPEKVKEIQVYFDSCIREALDLLSRYFWYLDE